MKKNVIKKKFRKLHKYLGFVFSIFIFHLTVTGILLLYPKELGIEKKFLNNNFLLKKYKMSNLSDVLMANASSHEFIIVDNSFYINNEFIDTISEKIVSLFYNDEEKKFYFFHDYKIRIYIFEETKESLQLVDVRNMTTDDKIMKVGLSEKEIILRSEKNLYKISYEKIVSNYNNDKEINWINIMKPPEELAKKYLKIHQGEGVSFHRIITELHSGKFFGAEVVFLMFISSLTMIFLIVSAFVFGINYKKKNKL